MITSDKTKNEKVSVWDTYVHKKNGEIMHFDIIVPVACKDSEQIFNYAEKFALKKGETNITVDASRCQFCHVEELTNEVSQAIKQDGHYVLEMEDIPDKLSKNPSKREMVLFIKGHFKEFRFTNFAGVPTETIQKIIKNSSDG